MDELVRMMTKDGSVKAIAITGADLAERARQIHGLSPVATAALGRALMAASMMGADLKAERGSVTLQFKGGGPLGTVTAVADSSGNPRGYLLNGDVEVPDKAPGKLDVGTAVGSEGTLTVIKDLGMKEPYIGSIQLISGEIADDVTAYFTESEQIPTACALGVLINTDQSVAAAGGYLVQLLPGADASVAEALERAVYDLGPVTGVLQDGADAEALLRRLLSGMGPELMERRSVEYHCYCSRQRVTRALISMGREELADMIAEQGGAELTCQFCDVVYQFTRAELEMILENASK